MKLKTDSQPDRWSLVRLEIIDNALYLHGSAYSEKVTKLHLNAHVDSVAIFKGETKAHFAKIEFSE